MKVILRRHAQTQGSLEGRYMGWLDEPLCEEGIRTASLFPQDDTVSRVYTSGLQRTGQTAKLLYPQARQIVLPVLNEMHFGMFEGKTFEELKNVPTYGAWLESGCEVPCPGGEERGQFSQRCTEAFLSVMEQEVQADREQAVFVVHGGTIMAVLGQLAEPEGDFFAWRTGFCEGYVLWWQKDAPRPLRLLETIHLPEGRSENWKS